MHVCVHRSGTYRLVIITFFFSLYQNAEVKQKLSASEKDKEVACLVISGALDGIDNLKQKGLAIAGKSVDQN